MEKMTDNNNVFQTSKMQEKDFDVLINGSQVILQRVKT